MGVGWGIDPAEGVLLYSGGRGIEVVYSLPVSISSSFRSIFVVFQ